MGGNKVYLAKYKTTKAWFPLNKIKYIYKTITLTGGLGLEVPEGEYLC